MQQLKGKIWQVQLQALDHYWGKAQWQVWEQVKGQVGEQVRIQGMWPILDQIQEILNAATR
jgi:hypothetical protein